MNYPLRFLWAALVIILISIGHRFGERTFLSVYRDFFKVWLSAGIYFAEMALWLLSLFGNFNIEERWQSDSSAELWMFNLLWTGGNILLVLLGNRYLMRMLRGYGSTFLIIQGYTIYFRHIAGELGLVLGSVLAEVSALALVLWWEIVHQRCRQCSDSPFAVDPLNPLK